MSVPAGQRSWKCPECGKETLLSVTQLDPVACPDCLAKMSNAGKTSASEIVAGPMATWASLPETIKLGAVVLALVAGLIIGYVVGTLVAKSSSTSVPSHSRQSSPAQSDTTDVSVPAHQEEERPPAPGPGYKWVSGRLRKDGTRGAGHWAKDPRYKGDTDDDSK